VGIRKKGGREQDVGEGRGEEEGCRADRGKGRSVGNRKGWVEEGRREEVEEGELYGRPFLPKKKTWGKDRGQRKY